MKWVECSTVWSKTVMGFRDVLSDKERINSFMTRNSNSGSSILC